MATFVPTTHPRHLLPLNPSNDGSLCVSLCLPVFIIRLLYLQEGLTLIGNLTHFFVG